MQDDTTVHLQLCLTRSAQSYATLTTAATRTATLTFQVCPQALQAWQHVTVLCQLYLRLRLGCLGTHGKDIEDEARAVQNLYLQLLLNVTYLLR